MALEEVADEVILVDSGSTDKTKHIADMFSKVHWFERGFTNFVEQRNFAIGKCMNDYVLSLDSDELPDATFLASIRQLKENGFSSHAYTVRREWIVLGKKVHCAYPVVSPDYPIRLFNKQKVYFQHSTIVHETLENYEKLQILDGCIEHHTFQTKAEINKKLQVYSALAAADLIRMNKAVNVRRMVFSPVAAFCKWSISKKGYKDGFTGLYLALYASRYTFLKYKKALKLQKEQLIHSRLSTE